MTPLHVGVLAVTAGTALGDIGRSVRESAYMFWDTLWALVLGFALSGAVQAFVSRQAMQRRLGNHRPAAVARASVYGMVSSSCSYAASAMARSLFARGADFLAAMVFMVASTNLVVELGIVLLVLIGWQFVAAELVGGLIMIVLLVAAGSLWLRGRVLAGARARSGPDGIGDASLDPAGIGAAGPHEAGGHSAGMPGAAVDPSGPDGWRRRIRTAAGWSDAAGYTMSDLTMLRKEMVVGFAVAGFLTVLVPARAWGDLFLRGHGTWTTLENAVVGPLVAILSFVCSIGNVPLAAALWAGGISFGGVVAFVFADLITLPLLLVYRKQYGGRMARRMLVVFWLVMSLAGLATEYLFRAAGWVPRAHSGVVVGDTVRWDWTTWLDLAAIVAFAVLYWLHRSGQRFGAGAGYAKDPVCGMQVEVAHAPASTEHGGQRIVFCSERCRDRFVADPARVAKATTPAATATAAAPATTATATAPAATEGQAGVRLDPVCGMVVDPTHAAAHLHLGGAEHWFCSTGCAEAFASQHSR